LSSAGAGRRFSRGVQEVWGGVQRVSKNRFSTCWSERWQKATSVTPITAKLTSKVQKKTDYLLFHGEHETVDQNDLDEPYDLKIDLGMK